MQKKPTVLFTSAVIAERVKELGREITTAYAEIVSPLTALVVMDGAMTFAADLLREIKVPGLRTVSVRVRTYEGTRRTRKPTVRFDPAVSAMIASGHVLVIDDIWDGGHTLNAVMSAAVRKQALSASYAVALNKRNAGKVSLPFSGWIGFDCPDKFVVGYGLDVDAEFRELPYVGYFE